MFQTEPTSRIWRHSFPVNCIKNEKKPQISVRKLPSKLTRQTTLPNKINATQIYEIKSSANLMQHNVKRALI